MLVNAVEGATEPAEAPAPAATGIMARGRRVVEAIEPWRLPASVFVLFVAARLTSAYTWFWGARTKHPFLDPPFGWLEGWLHTQMELSPVPAYPWVVEHLILPNLFLFGWTSFLLEVYLATALALGFATRLNGWIAALWALSLAVGNLGLPREPLWSLLAPVAVALLAAETRVGRCYGLDARLRPRWMESKNRVLGLLARWGM